MTRPDSYALIDGFCHLLEESGFFYNTWAVFADQNGRPIEPYFHAGLGERFKPVAQYMKKGFVPQCGQTALDSEGMAVIRMQPEECSSCPLREDHEPYTVLTHRLGNQAANSGWICTTIPEGRDEQEPLLVFREMAGLLVLALEEGYADPEGSSFREKQLMKFLEDSGNALIEIDNRRRLASVNKGAVALLGQKLHTYLGRPIEELIDTGFYGKFQQACSRVLHSLNSEHVDVFLKDWEGDLYKVSLELHSNRNSRGETVGLYALIKGSSDDNPVIDALRESEQRFIDLFDKAPAGYQSLDEEGYFLEVNQHWLDLLGYRKDEVMGHWFGDFLAPSYREVFRERFPLFKERGRIHSEFQMLRKDGEKRFISFEGRIGYKDDGTFKQTHCLLTDITEQRKSEELLLRNEQYFKSLFNFLNSGITILEPDKECGRFFIRNMNPSGELIFRVNLVDVQGRSYSDVFPEAEESGLLETIRQCCQTGRSQYLPLKEYKDERISIFLESYVAKLPSNEIMLIYDDRTSQVQMEKRVRQSEKMEAIGHLAGGIAHDFNNILTGILGFTELIRMKKGDSADILDYLDKIEGAGGRARKLVQQILSFSRQDMGRQELFLLKPLLQENLEFLRSVIPSTVVIEEELADKVPPVQGDPGGIREILLNLGSNACFAMNDRGVLRISLSRIEASESFEGALGQSGPGSYALLTVEDDGCGMSREVLDHIFEPYYTTREVGEGSGMGLPMVFGILKNHNANVQVFSTPGAGSVFKLYFPLLSDGDEDSHIKEEPKEGQAESILVIDDEQMNCTLYREFLTRLGYEVTDFLNPLEALEWLRSGEKAVDLVLSDQTMPEMTGTDLSRRIRQEFPEMPVLICTGFSPEINEENYREFGASGFLAKPFVFTDLADLIRSLLD